GIFRDRLGAVAGDGVRPRAEIVLVHAPRYGPVVNSAAAGLVAVVLHRDRAGAPIRILPPGDRLALDVRPQLLALEVAQLVVRVEVVGGQAGPALEPDHLHPGLAQLGRQNTAGGSHADNDDIGLFGCHGSAPPYLGARLQPDNGQARERVLARQIVGR